MTQIIWDPDDVFWIQNEAFGRGFFAHPQQWNMTSVVKALIFTLIK